MEQNKLVAPVVKWAGGKRQLLDILTPLLPGQIEVYCEPFVGGGALLFALQPNQAIVNDINPDLMRVYEVIRDDVDALISQLELFKNYADFFYAVREWDRDPDAYRSLSKAKKAARTIYLNKTCYNGLFRVNGTGQFNSPFGRYHSPKIVNIPVLRAVHTYFNQAKVTLLCTDYGELLDILPPGCFVYLDPPYDPVSDTASFTKYTTGGFDRKEQIRLRQWCDTLDKKGVRFMLSNSATDFVREQYHAYHLTAVRAKRVMNTDPSKRGKIDELVIRNYT